jgi:hypothetical protein
MREDPKEPTPLEMAVIRAKERVRRCAANLKTAEAILEAVRKAYHDAEEAKAAG